MDGPLTILGIESSCDDTAAAILHQPIVGDAEILASVVHGQTDLHAPFGGVVPEIAARAHAEKVDRCVEEALSAANVSLLDLDAIAVTAGGTPATEGPAATRRSAPHFELFEATALPRLLGMSPGC